MTGNMTSLRRRKDKTRHTNNSLFLLLFDLSQELLLGGGNLGLAVGQGDPLGGPAFLGDLLISLGGRGGVGTDGLVGLLVHALQGVASQAELDELGKLLLVRLLVLLRQAVHVVGHMA